MAGQAYQLRYQICPIVLTGGIAAQIPGGMLPLTTLFNVGIIDELGIPFNPQDLDNSFGHFNILPGGTLVQQSIAKYPFANQTVAANAFIREPLTLSVIMDAPMRGTSAWEVKHLLFTALKAMLDKHNNLGGMYTVFTPAYMYTNMLMLSL